MSWHGFENSRDYLLAARVNKARYYALRLEVDEWELAAVRKRRVEVDYFAALARVAAARLLTGSRSSARRSSSSSLTQAERERLWIAQQPGYVHKAVIPSIDVYRRAMGW